MCRSLACSCAGRLLLIGLVRGSVDGVSVACRLPPPALPRPGCHLCRQKLDGPYDDRILPVVLTGVLMTFLTVVWIGSIVRQAPCVPQRGAHQCRLSGWWRGFAWALAHAGGDVRRRGWRGRCYAWQRRQPAPTPPAHPAPPLPPNPLLQLHGGRQQLSASAVRSLARSLAVPPCFFTPRSLLFPLLPLPAALYLFRRLPARPFCRLHVHR